MATVAPDIEWSFVPEALAISALSVEYVRVLVSARQGTRGIDATAYGVEFTFLEDSADLDSATWYDAEWDRQGRARLLVGPGETPELAAGAYWWYVRLTLAGDSEVPIYRLPQVLRVE